MQLLRNCSRMRSRGWPAGERFLHFWRDGGLRLVQAMAGYDRAIVIDAMTTGTERPGTVRRLDLYDLDGAHGVSSVHDASLPVALKNWPRCDIPVPEDIAIWGIEVEDFRPLGEQLTPRVAAAVSAVTGAILADLRVSERRAA